VRHRPLILAAAVALCVSTTAGAQTLIKFASLPADTFAPDPTSGQFISPANGNEFIVIRLDRTLRQFARDLR
jgi:hypothetical protein